MIFTITPNPALDLGGSVPHLIPNEKAYVQNECRYPGGNAINAARIINHLGIKATAGGFLGGCVGEEIQNLLKKEGVPCRFIPIHEQSRISVTISDQKTHLQTRLSFSGPKIQKLEIQALMNQVKKLPRHSLLILGGSFPPGFTPKHANQILKAAHLRDIQTVIDVPGHLLKHLVKNHPILIKPNLMEYNEWMGTNLKSIPEVIRSAKKLTKKVQWICISSVEGGALLIHQNQAWHGRIPRIQIKTTVGAGDSMVGAMSAHLWQATQRNQPIPGDELLRAGLAAATATLMTPGTTLGDKKSIQAFLPRIQIQTIL